MDVLPCNQRPYGYRSDNICNPLTQAQLSLEKTSVKSTLCIRSACYCEVKALLRGTQLSGGYCEVEPWYQGWLK